MLSASKNGDQEEHLIPTRFWHRAYYVHADSLQRLLHG